jgi:hypothetical protein
MSKMGKYNLTEGGIIGKMFLVALPLSSQNCAPEDPKNILNSENVC